MCLTTEHFFLDQNKQKQLTEFLEVPVINVSLGKAEWIRDGLDAYGGKLLATVTTIIWAAIGTAIAIYIAKAVTGLRVSQEVEYEGLDLGEHGERAYNP